MKFTFTDLLGETKEIYNTQPEEVRQTMQDVIECTVDEDVKTVLDYLSNQQTQYVTFSHS